MQLMNVISWSSFKTLKSSKNLGIQYSETESYYNIFLAEDKSFLWNISLLKGSEDSDDFEANYKSDANKPLEYRSTDGLPKVASAKFVESLNFFPTGNTEQASLSSEETKYIKFHFNVSYTLSGVHVSWKDANFGDYIIFEVGVYTGASEDDFVALNTFSDGFKVMGTNSIVFDVPTVKTVPSTIDIGYGSMDVYIRVKCVNIGGSASKVIVNLIGWK